MIFGDDPFQPSSKEPRAMSLRGALRRTIVWPAAILLVLGFAARPSGAAPTAGWTTFAGNPQHTALSDTGAQRLEVIRWSKPVDLAPPTGTIFIHYGSPLVTPGNTVIVPVKTGASGEYRLD